MADNILDSIAKKIAYKIGVRDPRKVQERRFNNGVQVALLPGVTRGQQDEMIRQIAKNVVQKDLESKRYDAEFAENHGNDDIDLWKKYNNAKMWAKIGADRLEEKVHYMPEDFQDSWVYHAFDRPIDYGSSNYYSPRTDRVVLSEYEPSSFVHENGHRMDFDWSKDRGLNGDVSFMGRKKLGEVVNRENENRGLYSKLNARLKTRNGSENSREILGDIVRKDDGLIQYIPSEQAMQFESDNASLSGKFKFDELYAGHQDDYRENQKMSALASGMPEDVADVYATSVETLADAAEVMAQEGGAEWLAKTHPDTYAMIMQAAKDDPAIAGLANGKDYRFVIPYRIKEYEFPEYQSHKDDTYFRIPSKYGEGTEATSPEWASNVATKRGAGYFEYKDIDGKWQRQYDEDMRKAAQRMSHRPTFEEAYKYYVNLPDGTRRGFNDYEKVKAYQYLHPEVSSLYRYNDNIEDWEDVGGLILGDPIEHNKTTAKMLELAPNGWMAKDVAEQRRRDADHALFVKEKAKRLMNNRNMVKDAFKIINKVK